MPHFNPLASTLGALAASAATLATTVAAFGYCRTTSAMVPAGYDPTANGCITQGIPLKWPSLPVTYQLEQQVSAQVSFAETNAILDRSFDKWAAVICPGGDAAVHPALSLQNLGPTNAGDVSCDGSVDCGSVPHVVIFLDQGWPHNDPTNTLALTTLTFGSETGHVYAANIEINSAQHTLSTSAAAAPGTFSLEAILTHEAGHFVALAHSQLNTAVMYAFYQNESIALTPDDVAGVCAVYPPESAGASSKGCSCATAGQTGAQSESAAPAVGALGIAAARARRRRKVTLTRDKSGDR
jgi:MYXO-CTERM domain-containing protein